MKKAIRLRTVDMMVKPSQAARNLGLTILHLRRQRSMSQSELAMSAALDRTYISDIERGLRKISISVLERISNALDIEAWRLLQLSDAMNREYS